MIRTSTAGSDMESTERRASLSVGSWAVLDGVGSGRSPGMTAHLTAKERRPLWSESVWPPRFPLPPAPRAAPPGAHGGGEQGRGTAGSRRLPVS